MITFVYFDIGGVLLDWSDVFKGAAKKFNLDVEDIGKVFDENHDPVTKGELSAEELWSQCIKRYNLKGATDYNFLESWVSDYKSIEETRMLIKKIVPKYKIGLLSNIYRGMLPLLVDKRIIPDIEYDQIIFSCDVGMMKPNSDIYELAQKKAETNSEDLLLVDDRKDYCEGAELAGWNSFLFNSKNPADSTRKLENYLNL